MTINAVLKYRGTNIVHTERLFPLTMTTNSNALSAAGNRPYVLAQSVSLSSGRWVVRLRVRVNILLCVNTGLHQDVPRFALPMPVATTHGLEFVALGPQLQETQHDTKFKRVWATTSLKPLDIKKPPGSVWRSQEAPLSKTCGRCLSITIKK